MINTITIGTPLGEMVAGATENGICLLEFTDRKLLPAEYRDLERLLGSGLEKGDSMHLKALREQLGEYFEGTRKDFDIPLEAPGTDFQMIVWNKLREIPYGTTRSYQEQADILGKPDSVRAVANANGMNRISIIIPCHRVIGSDGSLTGYGGGLKRKRWLLDHEKKFSGQPVDLRLF